MLEILSSSIHRIYIDFDDVNQISLEVNDNYIYFQFESQHNLESPLRCLNYGEAESIISALAERANLLLIEEYDVITLVNLRNVIHIGLTENMRIKCFMRDQEHLYSTKLKPADAVLVFAELEEKLSKLEENLEI